MKLKAGKYWVGDLCYILPSEGWDAVCSRLGDGPKPVGGEFTLGKHEGAIFPTAYGDGVYYDQVGREFGVDSGTLGIFPAGVYESQFSSGGSVIDFSEDFEVSCVDGEMRFGHIRIRTDGGEEPKFFVRLKRDGNSLIFSMATVEDAYFHEHHEMPGLMVVDREAVNAFAGGDFASEDIENAYVNGCANGEILDGELESCLCSWQLLDKNHEPVDFESVETAIFNYYLMRKP
jgi:hypothetical protein